MQEDDLAAYRELRTQPEVMINTKKGCVDNTVEETKKEMQKFLSPTNNHKFLFGVFLASTGELIGEGGVHTLESALAGWPEIGYNFKKEHWGRGYGTEFLRGFLRAWWGLPRATRTIRVIRSSVKEEGEGEVAERVYADGLRENVRSVRVLEKLGFKRFREWTEPDERADKDGNPIDLAGYYLVKNDV